MPQSDLANQSDKLNVLVKEKIAALENYNQEIRSIDTSLQNAKASLNGIPGVQNVLNSIDQSIQENYRRGYAYQTAQQAEQKMFLAMQQAYTEFAQTVDNLEHPAPSTTQPLLTNGQQPVQNGQARPINAQTKDVPKSK